MDPLQIALTARRPRPAAEAWSALPDAPVVPHVERPRAVARGRAAAAGALHRLADAVAPPRPTPSTARPLPPCTGAPAH